MARNLSQNELALRLIMKELKSGIRFGKICPHRQGGVYWWETLSYGTGRDGRKWIFWRNYGSSACKPTLRELDWTIRNMLKTTPSEFFMSMETYDTYREKTGNQY